MVAKYLLGKQQLNVCVFIMRTFAEQFLRQLMGMLKFRTNGLRGEGSSKEEEKRIVKSFDSCDLETCRTDGVCI